MVSSVYVAASNAIWAKLNFVHSCVVATMNSPFSLFGYLMNTLYKPFMACTCFLVDGYTKCIVLFNATATVTLSSVLGFVLNAGVVSKLCLYGSCLAVTLLAVKVGVLLPDIALMLAHLFVPGLQNLLNDSSLLEFLPAVLLSNMVCMLNNSDLVYFVIPAVVLDSIGLPLPQPTDLVTTVYTGINNLLSANLVNWLEVNRTDTILEAMHVVQNCCGFDSMLMSNPLCGLPPVQLLESIVPVVVDVLQGTEGTEGTASVLNPVLDVVNPNLTLENVNRVQGIVATACSVSSAILLAKVGNPAVKAALETLVGLGLSASYAFLGKANSVRVNVPQLNPVLHNNQVIISQESLEANYMNAVFGSIFDVEVTSSGFGLASLARGAFDAVGYYISHLQSSYMANMATYPRLEHVDLGSNSSTVLDAVNNSISLINSNTVAVLSSRLEAPQLLQLPPLPGMVFDVNISQEVANVALADSLPMSEELLNVMDDLNKILGVTNPHSRQGSLGSGSARALYLG